LDGHECRIENGHGYVVTASVRIPYEADPKDPYGENALRFHHNLELLTEGAARDLRALNLYLGVHAGLFDYYWYVQDGETQLPIHSTSSDKPVQRAAWRVEPREIPAINAFVRRMRKPLTRDYIRLAWDHWEHAFVAGPIHMELLSLVMALEALFNVGQTDLRYRVARSMAVLLGESPDGSEYVFDAIKDAYDLRSKLVHTGKADLKNLWIDSLRTYVRRAILKLIDLDLPKEDVAEILTRMGFGAAYEITRRSRMLLTPRKRVLRMNAALRRK
jgi:hypothetical protein